MKITQKVPDKGDPSDIIQVFPKYNLQLHCCRYWWLRHWEFKELSFPYWRIYNNSCNGAAILYNNIKYKLSPDEIMMIPPNTSYATQLYDNEIPKTGYTLQGGRINSNSLKNKVFTDDHILHLFIHFNIGMPYDNISPGIFIFKLTDHLKEKLFTIKNYLNYEHTEFSFYLNLVVQSLISDLLSDLPEKSWNLITKNQRIFKVLRYIEDNVDTDLANYVLAEHCNMATNAFNRLFTQEIGVSPQKYIKKKRIDKACILLHHSDSSIDEIAVKTGFADRYHFSRIFKKVIDISPAKYRKEFKIQ